MKTSILNARTVAIVRDLRVEKRQGANGEFESKDILFRIAVDRDYKVTRQENGKTISERPTDFWLAKATGNVAQIFADHCSATKEDGKLISRHLLLSGNFENYQNTRNVKAKVQPQVNINGQTYQLDLEVEVPVENNNNTIFIVDSIEFLDSNPANRISSGGNASATVSSAVATPVTASPVPVAQPAQAPVQQVAKPAQPVQQVAQPVTQPAQVAPQAVAQPVQTQAPIMNPPVVGAGFDGQTAPF